MKKYIALILALVCCLIVLSFDMVQAAEKSRAQSVTTTLVPTNTVALAGNMRGAVFVQVYNGGPSNVYYGFTSALVTETTGVGTIAANASVFFPNDSHRFVPNGVIYAATTGGDEATNTVSLIVGVPE